MSAKNAMQMVQFTVLFGCFLFTVGALGVFLYLMLAKYVF